MGIIRERMRPLTQQAVSQAFLLTNLPAVLLLLALILGANTRGGPSTPERFLSSGSCSCRSVSLASGGRVPHLLCSTCGSVHWLANQPVPI